MNVLELFGVDLSSTLTPTQIIAKEYERSNLSIITRLVLRSFLDESMRLRHRLIDAETRSLTDLFVMLEKVLWHGFKSSVQKTMIALRAPDAELWICIGKVASSIFDMNESYHCIDRLDNITSSLIRIRAFLRLAVMQKKLADYFEYLVTSSSIRDFYEPWALMRHDECIGLSGALVALSVLDCNLQLDQAHLEEQPVTVELSVYIRTPSIPNDMAVEKESESANAESLRVVLDQKNFLEERNRYLEIKMAELKRQMDEVNSSALCHDNVKEQIGAAKESVSVTTSEHKNLKTLKEEKAQLAQLVSEREDSVRILRQQLADTKKVNVDLYEKIRIVEEKCRQFEKEIIRSSKQYSQEKEQQRQVIEALKKQNLLRESDLEQKADASETLKRDLAEKTEEYMQTLDVLKKKQEELIVANDKLGKLQRQNSELSDKLKQLPVIKQELEELTTSYKYKSEKLEDCEKALEELGGHLSESKLKVVELKEELLPLSEAEWEKDANVASCKGCNLQFSMSKRKHHCRNCGAIFCNSCTDARVKLPSNAKPVRVCLHCYNLLRSRHSSTLEENSSLNSF